MTAKKAGKRASVPKSVTDNIKRIESRQDDFADVLSSVGEVLANVQDTVNTMAKNHIVAPRKHDDALDHQIGQDESPQFSQSDDEVLVERPSIADVESPGFDEKARNLQFMNEKVTVMIMESADKNAEPIFEVAVNNHREIFVRGQEKTVPRFIVEGLARAKPVTYANKEKTGADGVRYVENKSTTGLRYAFSVVHDPSPLGKSWLSSVLAQH